MKEYIQELVNTIIEQNLDKDQIAKLKLKLCIKHKIKKAPTDIEVLLNVNETLLPKLKILQSKPTRSISGVSPIAVMTEPSNCPHGKCIFCPGGLDSFYGDVPQSYTGKEPATMRGIRNDYNSYLQSFNRLQQYALLGHNFDKIELIIMGGTFPATPKEYQDSFILGCFQAMNDFSDLFFDDSVFNIKKFKEFFELPSDINDKEREKRLKTKILSQRKDSDLVSEQNKNETSNIRCIALCIETKPDWAMEEHIEQMLKLGCTRVELGVQSTYEEDLKKLNRGHTVEESIKSIELMKKALLKVGFHMMPGLPKSTKEKDVQMFKEIFENPVYKPDALKIYPCMVMPGTPLFNIYEAGKFTPISTKEAAELIAEIKPFVPKYCRIMRVQRDIPTFQTSAGVDKTNLRQYVADVVKKNKIICNCIRCREPRKRKINWDNVKTNVMEFEASKGKEYFISFDDNDILLGYCRLRIDDNVAGIRELHVFGEAVAIGEQGNVQHKGLGKQLLLEAEKISVDNNCIKIKIISGIGVREYYRKLEYELEGYYMVKNLFKQGI